MITGWKRQNDSEWTGSWQGFDFSLYFDEARHRWSVRIVDTKAQRAYKVAQTWRTLKNAMESIDHAQQRIILKKHEQLQKAGMHGGSVAQS